MAKEYLDKDGLLYLWQKIKNLFAVKSDSIKNITRSGTTFTATKADGTTFTFTQQDNNNAVTQTATTTSADYEVLFSNTADNTTRTEAARKNSNLKFNPSTGNLQATQLNGVAIGTSPKFTDTNTWNAMKGATASADGSVGYVNAVPPKATYNTSYLRADGTWSVPPNTNTTYGVVSKTANGLAPMLPNETTTTKYLRQDGTWQVPPNTDTHWTSHLYVGDGTASNKATTNGNTKVTAFDNSTARESVTIKGTGATTVTSDANGVITVNSTNTTYSVATTSANGLMSSTDKSKLDSIKVTNGVLDSSMLPSYVDDVIEVYVDTDQTALSKNWFYINTDTSKWSPTTLTPETGKVYVVIGAYDEAGYPQDTDYTDNQYRWSGTTYVKLADGGLSPISNTEIDTIIAS